MTRFDTTFWPRYKILEIFLVVWEMTWVFLIQIFIVPLDRKSDEVPMPGLNICIFVKCQFHENIKSVSSLFFNNRQTQRSCICTHIYLESQDHTLSDYEIKSLCKPDTKIWLQCEKSLKNHFLLNVQGQRSRSSINSLKTTT